MTASLLLTFTPQPLPISHSFRDAFLEAAFARSIIGLRLHFIRPVVRPRERILRVVVIGVAFAVADFLHKLRRRVQAAAWRPKRSRLFRAPPARTSVV